MCFVQHYHRGLHAILDDPLKFIGGAPKMGCPRVIALSRHPSG
jgi:hypothetical protein